MTDHPEMVGVWHHHVSAYLTQYLEIGDDSRGYIERYLDGELEYDPPPRKWFIKNNLLVFGRISGGDETFGIDLYPDTANSTIVSGYDTVFAGQRYMTLDGVMYVDP